MVKVLLSFEGKSGPRGYSASPIILVQNGGPDTSLESKIISTIRTKNNRFKLRKQLGVEEKMEDMEITLFWIILVSYLPPSAMGFKATFSSITLLSTRLSSRVYPHMQQ